MIGAIFGDIIGSRFEFRNILTKRFPLISESNRFTDDSVMTVAVMKALMDSKDDFSDLSEQAVKSMHEVGRHYPYCGYGATFHKWMWDDNAHPYDSYGNGSAMRISPVGFAARDIDEAKALSAAVTKISHNHPEGMKGAEATAVAIVMARQGKSKDEIEEVMNGYYDLSTTVDEYRAMSFGHGQEICQVTMPQALACFFEGKNYTDVIRNCISIGGDSDTIAAIAGGIADAFYGVPKWADRYAKSVLSDELKGICNKFELWLESRKAA